jgi:hypothetical protein
LPGDEWLVTSEDTESYLLPPDQELVRHQPLFQLQKKEYLTVAHPFRDGKYVRAFSFFHLASLFRINYLLMFCFCDFFFLISYFLFCSMAFLLSC